jgi:hypothetical protein
MSSQIPHDNKWSDLTPSFMAPMSHYHLLQTESFYISGGSGYWFLNGRRHHLRTGDTITIPRFHAHRFESIHNDTQTPLRIEYRYDAQMYDMEERFFRNVLTYMWDCKRAGVEPGLCQICVFLAGCWMPGEILRVPWIGEYGRCLLNTIFMWTFAAVGLVFLGCRTNYREYYDPEVSRRMMEAERRKGK